MLSDEDRKTLLGLARDTVAAAAGGDALPTLRNPSGPLREEGAVFVTLRSGGELRGCMGHVDAHEALWESVRDMAAAAAERDPRFSRIQPREVPGLDIEVSVLSPMAPLPPDRIVIGVHGLYVKKDGVSGLLLPQVPVEWEWDRDEFLRRTFEKAGLRYPDPTVQIFGFTAEHFQEPFRTGSGG
ncbi:MAG TPA: AmmeMemoRadiSam system protein A [Planctomycetota bacterium]|nr:AmmeMemoRadiSam system protein A [Planctomycetota bacterium]